jgi:nicotinamide mononucleotide (NMN) deamidase PncC
MAKGALEKSGASWAFSITGYAGPKLTNEEIPAGTVWIGLAGRDDFCPDAKMFMFHGSRNEVRKAAAVAALEELCKKILPYNNAGNKYIDKR